jgi:hypothetical protein
LGIVTDERLSFHVNCITGKVKTVFLASRRYCRKAFGSSSIKQIYEGVAKAIVTHGCDAWGEKAKEARMMRKLDEAQRTCFLPITGEYSTTSTEALQIIANSPPLKHRVSERRVVIEWKNRVNWNYFNIRSEYLPKEIKVRRLRAIGYREIG